MTRTLLTLLISVWGTLLVQAQPIDIGITGGAMAYNGDLSPTGFADMIQQIQPAFGIFGRTSFSHHVSAKIMLNFGKVDGSDTRSPYPFRGLSFESNITEANLTAEWHPIRIRHTESSFTYPYFFGGIGMFHFNPKARLEDGSLIELQPLGTEGQGLPGYAAKYARTQVNVPFGVGVRFILSDRWSICLETGARYLLTDYLDDVSAVEVNHTVLFEGNGALAARLSNPNLPAEPTGEVYRRGSFARDWYYLTGILISYNFGDALRKAFRDPVPCYSGW